LLVPKEHLPIYIFLEQEKAQRLISLGKHIINTNKVFIQTSVCLINHNRKSKQDKSQKKHKNRKKILSYDSICKKMHLLFFTKSALNIESIE
jgi:hypothetical protein